MLVLVHVLDRYLFHGLHVAQSLSLVELLMARAQLTVAYMLGRQGCVRVLDRCRGEWVFVYVLDRNLCRCMYGAASVYLVELLMLGA